MKKFRRAATLISVALAAVLLILSMERTEIPAVGAMSTEHRLRSVLSAVKGAGAVELLVNESDSGEVIGVCVLSEHADDIATAFRIRRAVQTTLGIDNSRIEVIMMEADRR